MEIIGRDREKILLEQYLYSKESEFIAVYGRRRVGKTYLVSEIYKDKLAFSVTATVDRRKATQLHGFYKAVKKYGGCQEAPAKTWSEAFESLQTLLENQNHKEKKVVFIDELPWFDTNKSDFLSALGNFWNVWASQRTDILLIVCGSATSWMINKLFRNRGSLHNRVTGRMRIMPFTLKETEEYLYYRGIHWERKDIAHIYMAFGGIPFYLRLLNPGLSATQNIDKLCFEKESQMQEEFDVLFSSLFRYPQKHIKVLEVLANSKNGLSREKILEKAGMKSGGGISQTLEELIQCGFIDQYNIYSGNKNRYIYQIIDLFTIFFYKNMKKNRHLTGDYWAKSVGSGMWNNWAGQTFEKLCILHYPNICAALGVSGIITTPYAWSAPEAQIDLLIERADNAVNICECKFTSESFAIDKAYCENLRNKIAAFRESAKTRKTLFLTMITTFGLRQNMYSSIVQSEVTLDDLFS